MVSLKYFLSITKDYWGNFGFAILFLAALFVILKYEKEKIIRYVFLWYSILMLVFIYNPISLYVCRHIMEAATFDQYYMRFFSLIPIMPVIAYSFTKLIAKFTGIKKLVAVVAAAAVMVIMGKCIYAEDWYTKAENRNKVPQDVVTICDIFENQEGPIRIMAPQRVSVYLRQMESKFSMPYSRSVPDEGLELTAEKPDVAAVARYVKDNEIDYVVVWAAEDTLNAYLNYGFKLYGRTTTYAILETCDPTWTLTEYKMTSGDQGIFYILENVTKDKLIVIDGGDAANEQQVRDVIMEHGGVVDAWIITHYHQDHVDSFNAIYSDPMGIQIKEIYASPMDAELYHSVAQEWDDIDSFDRFMDITKDAKNVNYVARNDEITYDDLTITFINTFDDITMNGANDIPNNASLVFKIATPKRSALICADCHSQYMAEHLIDLYGENLDADILQCGHHGNNSMPIETGFYEFVSPEVAIFDAPDKIMTSPKYTAGALAAYFLENDVRIMWYKTAPNIFGL